MVDENAKLKNGSEVAAVTEMMLERNVRCLCDAEIH